MLAALWRMRMILATLFALWTIGLATGAIHPAGYLVRCLVIARVLPRCPQRLPILGVPSLAVDAYRNPRGPVAVAATGLIGIIIPTVWGLYLWPTPWPSLNA